ncbi:MAG: (2Fe-2S) ferredoxin domain-containing protein [Holosporales bacterium]
MTPLRHHVFFCLNRRPDDAPQGCCASKGAEDLFDYCKVQVKAKGIKGVRINRAGCLDRCAMGVTVVDYPAGEWCTVKTREDVDSLVAGLSSL